MGSDEREGESRREAGFAESSEKGVSRDGHGHEATEMDKLVGTLED